VPISATASIYFLRSKYDALPYRHALAVVSEGIAWPNFKEGRGTKRKHFNSRCSLIIPFSCLPKSVKCKYTPKNNLNFFPANRYHFDLEIRDPNDFARAILSGIKSKEIIWSVIENDRDEKKRGDYQLQFALAYSHCLKRFGILDDLNPPAKWRDGVGLTAQEQINNLTFLAKAMDYKSPASFLDS
jgi:hypothetical protein